jgi:hypothetical protein
VLVERIVRLFRSSPDPAPATVATGPGAGSGPRARLVALIAGLSDERLARLERGRWRGILLRGLAIALPTRFNPRRAGEMTATIAVAFPHPDRTDPDRFKVRVADGRCRVHRGPSDDPDLALEIGVADLIRLVTGRTSVAVLWVSGELDITGDPMLLVKLPDVFSGRPRPGTPKAPTA